MSRTQVGHAGDRPAPRGEPVRLGRIARIRRRTYQVLEVARAGDNLSRLVDVFIATLVAFNILALILESVASPATRLL